MYKFYMRDTTTETCVLLNSRQNEMKTSLGPDGAAVKYALEKAVI